MTTQKTKDIVKAHFTALFAADDLVDVKELARGRTPAPPRSEADIDARIAVYLEYAETREAPTAISGGAVPWEEVGAFTAYVVGAAESAAATARVEDAVRTVKQSLRPMTIGEDMDLLGVLGTTLPFGWRGAFAGESLVVEFETQNV